MESQLTVHGYRKNYQKQQLGNSATVMTQLKDHQAIL